MVTIRDEDALDVGQIRSVLVAAFPSPLEAEIVDRLRASCDDRVSLVAIADDRVVGQILFTPAVIDTPNGPTTGYGLAPLSVLPEFQRQGVGSRLMRAGLERLDQSNCAFVVVIGHADYYPRFGFVRASTYGVRCQWDVVPDEAFMIRVRDPWIASRLAGTVRYRPEFDEAG
jgi:putative acetyltransferase